MIWRSYAQNILDTFKLENYLLLSILTKEKIKLKLDIKEEEVDSTHYRSIKEKCLDLIHKQFDLQFETRIVNRFMAKL